MYLLVRSFGALAPPPPPRPPLLMTANRSVSGHSLRSSSRRRSRSRSLSCRMTRPSLDSSSFAGALVHGGVSCRRRRRRFKKPGKGHMCHNLVSHASENTARSTRPSRRVGRDSGQPVRSAAGVAPTTEQRTCRIRIPLQDEAANARLAK